MDPITSGLIVSVGSQILGKIFGGGSSSSSAAQQAQAQAAAAAAAQAQAQAAQERTILMVGGIGAAAIIAVLLLRR